MGSQRTYLLFIWSSFHYRNTAHITLPCIFHRSIYQFLSRLILILFADIAFFKHVRNGEEFSKLLHRRLLIEIGWTCQIEYLEWTAYLWLCYLRYKRLKVCFCESVTSKFEILETWRLLANDFCKHFHYSWSSFIFFELLIHAKPILIVRTTKMLNAADGGAEKGIKYNLRTIVTVILWYTFTQAI